MSNILFIGNSFTFANDLPQLLKTVASQADVDIEVGSVLRGGAYLHEFADPAHELGKRLVEYYPSKKWDYIVLQDQSFNPAGDAGDFYAAVDKLCEMFTNGEKLLFYSTWAYRDGTKKLSDTGMTYAGMLEALSSAYRRAADIHGGLRVPVGDAFAMVAAEHSDIDLYTEDDYHPSLCGTYLAACLFYRAVSGKSPLTLMTPEGIVEEQGSALRDIASRA